MASDLKRFHEACQKVLDAARLGQGGRNMAYAASYAAHGLSVGDLKEARAQALYVLTNLGQWRGEEAAFVKGWLKRFAEEE